MRYSLSIPSIEFLGSVPSCSSNLVVEIPLLLFPMQIPPSGVRSPQLVMSSVTSQVVAVKAENALLLSQVTRVSRQYSTFLPRGPILRGGFRQGGTISAIINWPFYGRCSITPMGRLEYRRMPLSIALGTGEMRCIMLPSEDSTSLQGSGRRSSPSPTKKRMGSKMGMSGLREMLKALKKEPYALISRTYPNIVGGLIHSQQRASLFSSLQGHSYTYSTGCA